MNQFCGMNKSALDNAMWGHGDRSLKSAALPYEDKIEAARAWMESRQVHQLGTEHLNQRKTVNA
jgi:hypothetical protein